ncbi:hypothetical protein Tco_0952307 [Tanacetum coccineum]|uniref:Uncharacterized protein n=1 Tax=Tanacetum coccineum TaxID=301880 RepID=A0ABQ5DYY0_9ASTR
MLKLTQISKEPGETLILPSKGVNTGNIIDKSLSRTTVHPVGQSKAPTDKRSKRGKIHLYLNPRHQKLLGNQLQRNKSLRLSMLRNQWPPDDATKSPEASGSAEELKNQPKLTDAKRLAILGVVIAQEDLNSKILSSLPPEWNTHVVVWMNKAEIETMSIDDLYNNFKIVEQSVQKFVGASSGAQNLAFMTAPSTSSTNDINTAKPAYEVSTVSPNVKHAYEVSTVSFCKVKIAKFQFLKNGIRSRSRFSCF